MYRQRIVGTRGLPILGFSTSTMAKFTIGCAILVLEPKNALPSSAFLWKVTYKEWRYWQKTKLLIVTKECKITYQGASRIIEYSRSWRISSANSQNRKWLQTVLRTQWNTPRLTREINYDSLKFRTDSSELIKIRSVSIEMSRIKYSKNVITVSYKLLRLAYTLLRHIKTLDSLRLR